MKLLENVANGWEWVQVNSGGLAVILAAIPLIIGLTAWLRRAKKKPLSLPSSGQGGSGGSASVGGNGVAIGGRGGVGGTGGNGGKGGGGQLEGNGIAIGGDGGDAGVHWRPSLGAPSIVARFPHMGYGGPHERDEFGFFIVGRGGAGGDVSATVTVDGHPVPLLPMLELLRVWAPEVIVQADATHPAGPKEFWDTVTRIDPATARAAVEHTRHCLEITIPAGLPAPDPYARQIAPEVKT